MRLISTDDVVQWTKTWKSNTGAAGFAGKGFDCNSTRIYAIFNELDALSTSNSAGVKPSL